MTSSTSFAANLPSLDCELSAPGRVAIGQSVPLTMTLTNRGADAVFVLIWGTPFEGWFAPYVSVLRDGLNIPYRGPTVKRADPGRDAYLKLGPGQSNSAHADLTDAFDLRQPGRYRIEPRIVLHDAVVSGQAIPPRPRQWHARLPLPCEALELHVQRAP